MHVLLLPSSNTTDIASAAISLWLSTFIGYDGNIIESSSERHGAQSQCARRAAKWWRGWRWPPKNRGAELRPNGLVATSNTTTLTRRHRSKSTRPRLYSSPHILLIIIINGREAAPRTSGRMLTAMHARFAATVQQHH